MRNGRYGDVARPPEIEVYRVVVDLRDDSRIVTEPHPDGLEAVGVGERNPLLRLELLPGSVPSLVVDDLHVGNPAGAVRGGYGKIHQNLVHGVNVIGNGDVAVGFGDVYPEFLQSREVPGGVETVLRPHPPVVNPVLKWPPYGVLPPGVVHPRGIVDGPVHLAVSVDLQ